MTERVVQYDLFGELETAERSAESAAQARSVAASAFLADAPWPDLLGWWLYPDTIEAQLNHGETKASYRIGPNGSPGWAWAIWRDGLRFEGGDDWQGWSHRPRWCIPWTQLRSLRDDHPEVTAQLSLLSTGRGHPSSDGWKWWTVPAALRPDGLHPTHLDAEQQPDWYPGCTAPETAFNDRLQAWHLTLNAVRAARLEVKDTTMVPAGRLL